MDASPFRRLPPEIRLEVYELVLEQSKPIDVLFNDRRRMKLKGDHAHVLALAQTCREIRIESLELFYSHNTFQVNISTLGKTKQCKVALMRLWHFLKSIDTNLVSNLHIVTDVGNFYPLSASVAGLGWELPYGLYTISQKFNQHFRGECVVEFRVEYFDGLTRDVRWVDFGYDWVDWRQAQQQMLAYLAERPERVMKSVWRDVAGAFENWRDGSWVERRQRWLI